ncbi:MULTISPECIES: YcaO-like family protein [Rhizobium]|uniref:YcaO-like family protein n=1 Tax=Rhizobium TaxID=379 RepID=UPI000B2D10FD|nr:MULTISPECIES: YcaO-like family protein [Rhizobium]
MSALPLHQYSDRSCLPSETLARVEPALARHGITRLARLTDLDRIGIPVWNAITPNSRSIVICQGKGIDDIDAQVSAAMEALERAVAGNPKIDIQWTTLQALQSEGLSAQPLNGLILAGRDVLDAEEPCGWVRGNDIIAECEVWVPYEAILLDDTRRNRFWQSSDGLASGNNHMEATFHGLLERIERDAEILWQFASEDERRRNCVDVASFHDPVIDRLAARVRDAGFRLQVFNRTSDIGIACFEAFIAPQGPPDMMLRYLDMTHGAGAHPNPVRAAIRAITEAAQSRLTHISGARDDIDPHTFSRPLPEHLRAALFFEPQPLAVGSGFGGTIAEMLRIVIARLKAAGITSAVVVEMNPHETEFSVAKVLVPGLENPDGSRRQRIGPRALKKILNSR